MTGEQAVTGAGSAEEPSPETVEELDRLGQGPTPVEEPVPPSETDVLRAERDEYLDTLRRLQADFDNYRKRMARQQTEHLERATESLVERLLPVLDALDLARAHVPEVEVMTESAVALARIEALLRDTLAKEGLTRIEGVDEKFDPALHDAVAHASEPGSSADDAPSGPVVDEVMRAGYQLRGKVLRPAMVRVRG